MFKLRNFIQFSKFSKQFSTKSPIILGIETSCDDTGVALIDGDGKILGESLKSQQYLSTKFGGVVPLIAAKQHELNIEPTFSEALIKSRLSIEDVDAVAVTIKPGLVVCLKAGVNFALNLCRKINKPLIPIHHMKAHALTARWTDAVQYPYMCLLISGGNSIITWVKSVDEFFIIGQTLDNSPGEVLDKVARRLKLINLDSDYCHLSGGALIERLAKDGDPFAIQMPSPTSKFADCNFSFSAIFSGSLQKIEELEEKHSTVAGGVLPNHADFCASVQHAVFRHLAKKIQRAFEYAKLKNWVDGAGYPKTLVVSGGVACNSYIRNGLKFVAEHFDCLTVFPPTKYCTDNGVMIAWNGLENFKSNIDIITDIPETMFVHSKCPIGEDLIADVQSKRLREKFYRHLKSIDLRKNFYTKHQCEKTHFDRTPQLISDNPEQIIQSCEEIWSARNFHIIFTNYAYNPFTLTSASNFSSKKLMHYGFMSGTDWNEIIDKICIQFKNYINQSYT